MGVLIDPAPADHGQPEDEFHEATPTLERFYSAKSEMARSQEDLRVHGEVIFPHASSLLRRPCVNPALAVCTLCLPAEMRGTS